MRFRFYIGEGERAENIIGRMVEILASVQLYRDALIEDFGADNLVFFPTWPGQPQGFVFRERVEKPGLKMGAGAKSGFTYFPDLATEEGIKIRELLYDKRLEFDPQRAMLNELGLMLAVKGYCETCGNAHAVYKSSAFFLNGIPKIFVKVPGDEMLIPPVPNWLREVKESEWLSAQGK